MTEVVDLSDLPSDYKNRLNKQSKNVISTFSIKPIKNKYKYLNLNKKNLIKTKINFICVSISFFILFLTFFFIKYFIKTKKEIINEQNIIKKKDNEIYLKNEEIRIKTFTIEEQEKIIKYQREIINKGNKNFTEHDSFVLENSEQFRKIINEIKIYKELLKK